MMQATRLRGPAVRPGWRLISILVQSFVWTLLTFSSSFAAPGRIFYSAPHPLFPLPRADNGELFGGPLAKVVVDINGDGYEDAVYHLFTGGHYLAMVGQAPLSSCSMIGTEGSTMVRQR
jgi:hypothetical protein